MHRVMTETDNEKGITKRWEEDPNRRVWNWYISHGNGFPSWRGAVRNRAHPVYGINQEKEWSAFSARLLRYREFDELHEAVAWVEENNEA